MKRQIEMNNEEIQIKYGKMEEDSSIEDEKELEDDKPKRIWSFCFTIKKESIENIIDSYEDLKKYIFNLGKGFQYKKVDYIICILESHGDFYKIKGRIGLNGASRKKFLLGLFPEATIDSIDKEDRKQFDIKNSIIKPIIFGKFPENILKTEKEFLNKKKLWEFCFQIKKDSIDLNEDNILSKYILNVDIFKYGELIRAFGVLENFDDNLYQIRGRVVFKNTVRYKIMKKIFPTYSIKEVRSKDIQTFHCNDIILQMSFGDIPDSIKKSLKKRDSIRPFIASDEDIHAYFAGFFDGYLKF